MKKKQGTKPFSLPTPRLKLLAGCLLVLLFSMLLFSSCSKNSPSHSVNRSDYLALEDKNENKIYYGMTRDELGEMFTTTAYDEHWEAAHENLRLHFTSWVLNEDPILTQMEVTQHSDHLLPSWALPQGVRIGDSKQKVVEAMAATQAVEENYLDLLFAQDPKYSGKMYEITPDDLDTLSPATEIYRMVFTFEDDVLVSMVLGDLESMA